MLVPFLYFLNVLLIAFITTSIRQRLLNSQAKQLEMPRDKHLFEIIAAIITGLGKILLMDILQQKLLFILLTCSFWIGYVIWSYRADSNIFNHWGFKKDNFQSQFLQLFPSFLICVGLFFLYGWYFDTLILNWHLLPILLCYPIWGVIQQFLVVGLIASNLKAQNQWSLPNWLIILITAILFGIVHYPFPLLIVGTFLLAIVYTAIYLKDQNLWVLGIYHGWLGAFFYFFVLNRDPFMEVFGI